MISRVVLDLAAALEEVREIGAAGAARGSGSEPKGQVESGKVVQYSIRDRRGNPKYIGTTNNPRCRAAEHRESGKPILSSEIDLAALLQR